MEEMKKFYFTSYRIPGNFVRFASNKKIYPVHHAIKSTRQLWIGSGLEPVKQCHIYPTRPEPTFCQLKIPQYDDDKKDQIYYPSRYIVTTKIHSQQHMSSIQQIQQQYHHHSHHIRRITKRSFHKKK